MFVRRLKKPNLAKKPHLTNKKYIIRSLKNLFANVRPWISKFAVGQKKSQPQWKKERTKGERGVEICPSVCNAPKGNQLGVNK